MIYNSDFIAQSIVYTLTLGGIFISFFSKNSYFSKKYIEIEKKK